MYSLHITDLANILCIIYVMFKISTENESDVLADNLREDYMENRHNIDVDEWPPGQPKTVVNVALIHYKGSRTEQEFIEISKRHKEGTHAVDELAHHSRVTKDITKIFTASFINSTETETISNKPPKSILIEGAPGIGKTVLAKKIAYLWAKKELLPNVKILFLGFLRDPALQSIKTTEHLIQYFSNKCLDGEQIKSCIKQIMGLQVGIVMDGFDEYPEKLRKRSFINDLIKRRVFRNSTVVLTSRPTATVSLHDKVDRRVEILGFAQEERDEYILESLDLPEQREELQDYLKCQPIINGLVYVPLHLAILLYLFKAQSKLPKTLTEMNESFILHTIYRSLSKDELTSSGAVTFVNTINDLRKDVLQVVKGLSKLAYIGLQTNKLVFSYDEIKETCPEIENNDLPGALNGFGLLQVVQHFSARGAGATISFNFIHYTMQEFLAALHVSNIAPHEEQLSLMKKTFWSSTYNFMWMMYVGINGIHSHAFVQFLYKIQPETNTKKLKMTLLNNIKSDKLKCLHLFQCFMEAKSETVPNEISFIFDANKINFNGLPVLPHHISSLTLYISKYSMQLQSLNLRDCHIGDVGMNILERFFTANPDRASSIKDIDLFGNNSILLWNVYCAIFKQKNLKKLNWSSLEGVNIEEIVEVMNNNVIVKSLDISNNHFKNSAAERIAKVLSNNVTLEELDFSNNDITTRGATFISDSIQNSKSLKCLKLSWRSRNKHYISTYNSRISFSQLYMEDVDVQIVAKILCNNKTVTELDLSKNNISVNGAESISKCIESNKSLKEINISKSRVSDTALRKMAVALQRNQTIQKFNVSHNKISDEGVLAISECLKNNTTLQELNMSHNKISNNGMININEALKINTTLRILDISHNVISDDGLGVSDCLKINKSLQELNISYNMISNNGLINIGKALQGNTTLRLLNVSYNKISDDGVISFSDDLKKLTVFNKLMISWNDGVYLILDFMIHSCIFSKIKFGNTGAALLSAFIYNNTIIQQLDISYNNISDDGAEAISECLKNNNTLQQLDMSYNNISDDGAEAISECLKNNNTLQQLDMSYNKVTNKGVIKILRSIKSNGPLHTLNLNFNIVTKSGLALFYNIYENLKNLHSFQISYNKMLDGNPRNIYNVLMHFSGEYVYVCKQVPMMNLENKSAKAKVLCLCAMESRSIKSLDISNREITSEEAKVIAKAIQGNTSLQKLDISHNNISDDGALAISECLKENFTLLQLNISYNNVSDNGIISIGEVMQLNTTLQMLDISFNKLSNNGVIIFSEYLKNKSTLHRLRISWNNVPIDLDSTVKSLDIHGDYQLGDTGAILVSAFLCEIEKLDMSCSNITDVGAVAISEYLKNSSTLQKLNLSENRLSINGIIIIAKALYVNTTLLILDISQSNLRDDGAVAISKCLENNNTLQEINMSSNKISDVGIISIVKGLQVNKTLQKLDISHNNLSDDGAIAISECLKENTTLLELNVSYINVSDDGIINIGEALYVNIYTSLQKLNISHNYISDEGAAVISRCLESNKTLQELDISHNKISNSGIISIGKALEFNSTLQILDMSHNHSYTGGVLTFSDHLKEKSKLHHLRISWNNIHLDLDSALKSFSMYSNELGSTGAILVSAFLHHNTNIYELDISCNNVSDDGAVAISESLQYNNTLQVLNMSENEISNHGIISISKALQINKALQMLDISHNKMSDDGATAIGKCLKNNNTLRELNMSHNKISNNGVTNIGEALQMNTSLRILDVSHNNISDDGAIIIGETLRNCYRDNATKSEGTCEIQNCVLEKLHMSYNCISSEGILTLSNCFKSSNTLKELTISWNNCKTLVVLDGRSRCCHMSRKQFGDIGTILTLAFLFQNDKVQILNLSHNNIYDDGAVAISEYLRVNKTLKELNISSNYVTNHGIIKIAGAIQINATLRLLDISSNNLSRCTEVAKTLKYYLKHNNVLQILLISWKNANTTHTYAYNVEANNKCYVNSHTSKWFNDTSVTNVALSHIYTAIDHWLHEHCVHFLRRMPYKLQFDDIEAHLLTAFVHDNVNIKILEISNKKVSQNAVVVISNFVKENAALQKLIFSSNEISEKAVQLVMKAVQINTTLQSLNISFNNINDDGAAAISECLKNNNKLRELDVSHNELSNTGIVDIGEALQTNTTLQILDISYNNISDDRIINKDVNASDKDDLLCDHSIFSKGIVDLSECLKSNYALQKLIVSWNDCQFLLVLDGKNQCCNMSSQYFGDIGAILTLAFSLQNDIIQSLNISCNDISDDGAVAICEYLKANRMLKELNISNNNITSHGIIKMAEAIQINRTLRLLDISENFIFRHEEVVTTLSNSLKHNNTLKVLGISWSDTGTMYVYIVGINNECYVNNTWPRSVSSNNTVHYVCEYSNEEDFDDCQQFDQCLYYEEIPMFDKLQFDDIEAKLLTALIHNNYDIQAVKIVKSEISDKAAVVIGDFLETSKPFQKFELSHNIISSEAIEIIMKTIETDITFLKVLDISSNNFSDDKVKYLNPIISLDLEILNIAGNNITEEGAKTVADVVQNTPTLLSLFCCNNNLSDNGATIIGDSLKFNNTLKILCLSLNRITSLGITKITEIIKVNTTLQRLDISHNNISDDGAIAIGDYLKVNKTLEELNLSDNKITDDGIEKIAEAIKSNSTLVKLNISYNSMSNYNEAEAMSKCLKVNNTLTELDMSWNNITSNGAVNVAKAIQINTTLQKLDISCNCISIDVAKAFGSCLEHNSTLEKLVISWNYIDIIFIFILKSTCYVNTMWPYAIYHNHTKYFIHRYGSTLSWSDQHLIYTYDLSSMGATLSETQYFDFDDD